MVKGFAFRALGLEPAGVGVRGPMVLEFGVHGGFPRLGPEAKARMAMILRLPTRKCGRLISRHTPLKS